MQRLNKSLADTLEKLRPYDGDEDFMDSLYGGESLIDGLSCRRVIDDIKELQDAGMLSVFEFHGKVDSFSLTSSGRDYRRNGALDVAKVIGRYAFQFLVGASGGLVVLLLDRLLQ